jgi:hypothetical protein
MLKPPATGMRTFVVKHSLLPESGCIVSHTWIFLAPHGLFSAPYGTRGCRAR